MTNSTLAFQPEAERYYAQGYWRDGDLWGDFDARSREHAERVALVLEHRAVTYGELRGAAVPGRHLPRVPARRRRGLAPVAGRGRRGRRGRDPARPPLDRGGGGDARLSAP